jgi:hypothetical protein
MDKVVCTCSTTGDMAERYSPSVMRVDRRMAMAAVMFPWIHVLASLKSTMAHRAAGGRVCSPGQR